MKENSREGRCVVALDVGGSHVSAALVCPEGLVGTPVRYEGPFHSYDDFLDRMESAAAQAMGSAGDQVRPIAVGCGLPGALDPRQRTVISAPNLPCLVGHKAGDDLEKLFSLPVRLENDANLAALGEYVFDPRSRGETLLALTLGTGVGGGVVWKGQLMVGAKHSGMELGHVTIHPQGLPCACGNAGCLESYASTKALERYFREETGGEALGREIVERARAGDSAAQAAAGRLGDELGIAVASFTNVFVPDLVVLTGGLSLAGDILAQRVAEVVARCALPGRPRETAVRISADPLKSVLLGAGAWAMASPAIRPLNHN